MAHTLTIYYGETAASTINLALSAAGPSGAFLGDGAGNAGYTTGIAIADVSYNASLYNDGARPRFSRYQNIYDDIEVTVSDRNTDETLKTLGKIKQALWQARYYFEESNETYSPCYIAYKPHGSTNTAYSILLGGYVDESSIDDAELINGRITVRIKLEREPFWRDYPPTMDYTTNSAQILADLTTNAKPWGSYAVSSIGGHLPALTRITFAPDGAGTIDKIVMGYRSGTTRATGPGIWELEATQIEATDGLGTNCTKTADATASPGGAGNTRVTCTFGTKTDADRITVTLPSAKPGTCRVFLRAKCNTANTVTARLKYYASITNTSGAPATWTRSSVGVVKSTDSITFSNTAWAMIDMGVVRFMDIAKTGGYGGCDNTITIAASATTTADVYFDFLFLVPCDEYYVTMSGLNSSTTFNRMLFSNIEAAGQQYPLSQALVSGVVTPTGMTGVLSAIGTGELLLPPGSGNLYWVTGNSSWQNTFTATNNCQLGLYKTQRYLTARGNG